MWEWERKEEFSGKAKLILKAWDEKMTLLENLAQPQNDLNRTTLIITPPKLSTFRLKKKRIL
jgi:hypothetical protein